MNITIPVLKNTLNGITSKLDTTTEKRLMNVKKIAIQTVRHKIPKETKNKKKT